MAVVPLTLNDGLQIIIPAGTQVAFCSNQQNLGPDRFDPARWLGGQRRDGERNDAWLQFPSTTDDWLNWGSGTHTCPGRFLADVSLKLILVHLLTNFDIRCASKDQHCPADSPHNFLIVPDMKYESTDFILRKGCISYVSGTCFRSV